MLTEEAHVPAGLLAVQAVADVPSELGPVYIREIASPCE